MPSKVKFVFSSILLFLYVFDFTLPVILRSSFLVFLILFLRLLFDKKYSVKVALLFKDRTIIKLIFGFISFVIFSFIISVFHNTYDFSFIRTLFSNLIALLISILLVNYIYEDGSDNVKLLLNLILCIFVVQSIIEILALSNNSFRTIIQFFNQGAESSNEKGIGFRSLALSNATVSTLGGLFGIMYIVFCYRILKLNKFTYWDILILCILIIGNFFGGRSGYIGLILGFLILLFKKDMRKLISKFLLYFIGSILLFMGIYRTSLIPSSAKNLIENKILPFVFEAYYSYENNEGLETSSTNDLFENHYFSLSTKTFFLGDGRFIDHEGSSLTYMHTDAGFMRVILFGGILLQIFMIYWFFILIKPLWDNQMEEKFLYILLFLYTLLFHIKTISFAYATFNNRIMFLIVFVLLTERMYKPRHVIDCKSINYK